MDEQNSEKIDTQSDVVESYKDLLKYFLDEFSLELLFNEKKPQNKKEEFLIDVFNRMNDIFSVFERLNRYPVYFEKFYPEPTLISEAEALEYHLHSYLQEIYSLREKMERLLNIIRKKAKLFKIVNTEDVDKIINHLKAQVKKGLNDVVEARDEHVHNKSVRDLEITKARMLRLLREQGIIDEKQFQEKYTALIETSRQKYVHQAKKNSGELIKMMSFVTCRMGHVLSTYFGHDSRRFTKLF